jgi:hypothetical protein
VRRMKRPRGLSDVMRERRGDSVARPGRAPARVQRVLELTTAQLVRIARLIEETQCSYEDAVRSIRFKVW